MGMSQDFMDPEIFADFIIEAREHLETIEPNLLELEKTPDNLGLLNEIFRPMHSLKGASGFLGLNKMNRLAHKAENILDELRKGTMSVTSEIMDVILTSTDALRQMIESLESSNTEGDVDTAPIIETLDAIMAGEMPASPVKAAAPAAPVEAPVAEEPAELAEPEPEAAPAPAPAAMAAPDKGAKQEKEVASSAEWIASRAKGEPYALTAFGEAHLKDFIEEARENTSNLGSGLLELEKHPDQDGMVNDLFRFFHNLKGNSGIIGYQEMNRVTHEAETLLNSVRHGDKAVSRELVDLLLLAVDVLDALIAAINPADGKVTPFEIEELIDKLSQAVAGGVIELPDSLRREGAADAAPATSADVASAAADLDEDLAIFKDTIAQQQSNIDMALKELRQDGTSKDYIDGLYRSLISVQNSAGFMGFEEIKVYAQRTAGIVDQGRISGLDFSLMVDLLDQECAILKDMVTAAVAEKESGAGAAPEAPEAATKPAEEPAKPQEKPAPAPKAEAAKPEAAKPAPEKAAAAPAAKAPAAPAEPAAKPAAPAAAPAAPAAAKPAAAPAAGGDSHSKTSSTIRVDHEKLDRLMELIGELIINRNRYTMIARQLEDSDGKDVAHIAQDISETTYAMARISDDLQDTIMKVRMVPVASVFSRFPRLVRDLSRKSGKEVDLIMEGEETELDKSVVEVIGDPLVHLIRNSVDHGVEEESVRRAAGKDPKGRVWLRAYHKGNSVAIEIEDDGKGIDPEKMREVAIRKGIITPEEAKALDDREARELIFAPGFSSAEVITDISGRGVGMDVVRTNIKSLKGTVSITSEVGKGTKFTLSLPLTLAIIDALMITVDDAMFAIPLDAVSETTKIEAHRLTDVKGRKAVTLRGEVLGIISLAELLGLPSHMKEQDVLSVVVIHDNDRRLGLVVDRLLERQEIVIKPLSAYLGDLKGISGATIMGDGSVILILDPHEIYMMATSKAL
ncbi:CheA signal transduction histidine kinase [uncultured delta proteobacterium]|uniref:Chemotaxis protein CheA n=1 Tax=uncultured delta proteobacterium TaxID=34034 RepID=A0A212J0E9_9DELT|nr:CheA signal transduction histidine kinase [uncultured delta proteobacterium]